MKHIKAYEYGDQLYADEFPDWEIGSPFGHLLLKYGFILSKLNIINETINEILSLDARIRDLKKEREDVSNELYDRPIILKMRFCTELKIATDDLIALNSILYQQKKRHKWPDNIESDSIGTVLKNNFSNGFEELKDFEDLLFQLNGLGNSVKHSFINTQSLWHLCYEPNSKVIGFYNHFNEIKKHKIQVFEVDLVEFASDYNNFLQKMKKILKYSYCK